MGPDVLTQYWGVDGDTAAGGGATTSTTCSTALAARRKAKADAAILLAGVPKKNPTWKHMFDRRGKNKGQGLTLVHFSAQRQHFLQETLGTFSK